MLHLPTPTVTNQGSRSGLECIDGFQMSIKRPTSLGQARIQETAVQQIFHLESSSFFLSLSTSGKDST